MKYDKINERKDFNEFVSISLHAGQFYESITGTDLKGDISYMGLDIVHTHLLHNLIHQYNSAFVLSGRVSIFLITS